MIESKQDFDKFAYYIDTSLEPDHKIYLDVYQSREYVENGKTKTAIYRLVRNLYYVKKEGFEFPYIALTFELVKPKKEYRDAVHFVVNAQKNIGGMLEE